MRQSVGRDADHVDVNWIHLRLQELDDSETPETEVTRKTRVVVLKSRLRSPDEIESVAQQRREHVTVDANRRWSMGHRRGRLLHFISLHFITLLRYYFISNLFTRICKVDRDEMSASFWH